MKDSAGEDALASCIIGVVAGLFWMLWAAAGLAVYSTVAAIVVGVAWLIVSLSMLAVAIRRVRVLNRQEKPVRSRRSPFSTWRYCFTVIAEIMVCGAGSIGLNVAGSTKYIPPFIAVVVGVHFFGLRFMKRSSGILGVTLIMAGCIGMLVGLFGGSDDGITAVTGIVAAVSLTGCSLLGLRSQPDS